MLCSDFSQRSCLAPGRSITWALFAIQHHPHLQNFCEYPLPVPATCCHLWDSENQWVLPTLNVAIYCREVPLAPAHLIRPTASPRPHQLRGILPPLIGHKIGHVLGVARPWEPRQVRTEVPREQCHVLGRGQEGPPCGRERGHEAWSHSEQKRGMAGSQVLAQFEKQALSGAAEADGCDVGGRPGGMIPVITVRPTGCTIQPLPLLRPQQPICAHLCPPWHLRIPAKQHRAEPSDRSLAFRRERPRGSRGTEALSCPQPCPQSLPAKVPRHIVGAQ